MAIALTKENPKQFAQKKVTKLILRGTLIVAVALCTILILHDIASYGYLRTRIFIALGVIVYLAIGEFLLYTRYAFWVNWMVILLYGIISYLTLFFWGLNTPVGILSAGFVVILPSLLIGARYIFPVTVSSIIILLLIQFTHASGTFRPHTDVLNHTASFWDLTVYATIFSIFALVSWLSRRQIEVNLIRAHKAEATIKAQKEDLRIELERESARLREAQLQELQQLHKFAIIGQSTTATLHELSNHLSVLNLDLDDLRQQSRNTKAIENANESIRSINQMVQAARRQLNNYDENISFKALPVLKSSLRDLSVKFSRKNVSLRHDFSSIKGPCVIDGDPLALTQIISVLAVNGLDACVNFAHPEVTISAKVTSSSLVVTVRDNGMGVNERNSATLFSPVRSQKPSGLGVGLYIAKHLTETHFSGSIKFKNLAKGAAFTIIIPKAKVHHAKSI